MYFPSNYELTMVGNDHETLTSILELLHKGGHGSVDGHVTLPAKYGEPDHDLTGPLVRPPALVFYAYGKPHTGNYVAQKFTKVSSLSHFIYSWLDELSLDCFGIRPDIDGSKKQGWRLNAGYNSSDIGVPNYTPAGIRHETIHELYPDISFYCFQFIIRPEWTFYAK